MAIIAERNLQEELLLRPETCLEVVLVFMGQDHIAIETQLQQQAIVFRD